MRNSGESTRARLGRSRWGALLTTTGMVAFGIGIGANPALGSEVPARTVELHNPDADQEIDCPDDEYDYWHFIIAPNNDTYAFQEMTLNLDGDLVTFGPTEILLNGDQLDNVFVAVPHGYDLDDLSNEGDPEVDGDESTAEIAPPTGDPKFVLSHTCEGEGNESSSSSSSSTSSTTTTTSSTTTTTTTTTTPTTTTTTTTTLPCPYGPASQGDCLPSVAVTAICYEIPPLDEATIYWFEITNLEDVELTVDWADGSAVIPALGSTIVSSNENTITATFQDDAIIATADEPVEACTRDVNVTKVVEGPSEPGTVYTIQVSRLVGESYLPEGGPFLLEGGESITIPLPSTFNPEGVTYFIEEVDAGGAAAQAVAPDTFVVNGHKGETVSVTITNSFAAISLDKQVSKATDVHTGDTLSYALVATNVGAVTLDPVTITDRLPAEVTYVGFSVVDDAGTCTLTEPAAPQLVTCELADALDPAASTKAITLEVTVNDGVADGTQIVNQAMAIGTYAKPFEEALQHAALLGLADAPPTDLSCQATSGQVCDLSAKVGSGVTQRVTTTTTTTTTTQAPTTTAARQPTTTGVVTTLVGQAGATSTVATGGQGAAPTTLASRLPSTGSDATSTITIIGMGLVVVGLTMMLGSRRRVVG
jgi:uncharacterized repeat protein (TIGR01451 family)/LPXTG-motif cell wall-anchored protein